LGDMCGVLRCVILHQLKETNDVKLSGSAKTFWNIGILE